MRKCEIACVALLTLAGSAAAAAGQTAPHWSELLVTEAERVEIDRGAIQAEGHNVRRVWLRWNLSRGTTPGFLVNTVEQAELDCRSGRGRVLQSHREMVDDAGRHRELPATDVADSRAWHSYPDGSLGARVWRAACETRGT